MKTEISCGAVVFTKKTSEIHYLLVQSTEGFWGFPKGHMEENETETETALREIREETGLSVSLLPAFRTEDSHLIPGREPPVMKKIIYFLAEYENQSPIPRQDEISALRLLPYRDAMALFQFESSRRILTKAHQFLQKTDLPL